MRGIEIIDIKPKYRKDNGLYVLDIDNFALPKDFIVKERITVTIPAGVIAGQHKHPRHEAFVALSSNLLLIWLDENSQKNEVKMKDGSDLKLIIMPPNFPHAVINKGSSDAVLLELANDIQHNVVKMDIF